MKIKDGYVLKNVGGQYVGIYVGDEKDALAGMIRMNATGAFVWQCLEKETTPQGVAQQLAEHYAVDIAAAETDVAKIIDLLKRENILEL